LDGSSDPPKARGRRWWACSAGRDGKIAGGHDYETREHALEAAGLSE
jgi:hypothetical protein